MSSDTMQLAGEFQSCGCIPHTPKLNADWKPKRYRDRRGPEDLYECARFIHKGKVIFKGKQAVEHFCMIQQLERTLNYQEFLPEERMGDGQHE